MESSGEVGSADAAALRRRYGLMRRQMLHDPEAATRFAAERKLIAAKREALVASHARGEIDNTIVRRIQIRLDLEVVGLPTDTPSPPETELP